MARARNIKPAIFKNELLGVADPYITILFTSLWCLADRLGRLEDRPLRIKAETFPYREGLDVNGYLTELERLEFICRYEVDGSRFIQIINFEKHQAPHKTEKESVIPCMKKNSIKSYSCNLTVKQPLNDDGKQEALPPDLLIPDSLIPDLNTNVICDAKDACNCPHEQIINLYHDLLPTCPRVKEWTNARRTKLKARWNESKKRQDIAYWENLFKYISDSDFLMGRTQKPFMGMNLEWIVTQSNFTKIIEGNYENRI